MVACSPPLKVSSPWFKSGFSGAPGDVEPHRKPRRPGAGGGHPRVLAVLKPWRCLDRVAGLAPGEALERHTGGVQGDVSPPATNEFLPAEGRPAGGVREGGAPPDTIIITTERAKRSRISCRPKAGQQGGCGEAAPPRPTLLYHD